MLKNVHNPPHGARWRLRPYGRSIGKDPVLGILVHTVWRLFLLILMPVRPEAPGSVGVCVLRCVHLYFIWFKAEMYTACTLHNAQSAFLCIVGGWWPLFRLFISSISAPSKSSFMKKTEAKKILRYCPFKLYIITTVYTLSFTEALTALHLPYAQAIIVLHLVFDLSSNCFPPYLLL